MFQVLFPANGGQPPKHVALKVVYFYIYFLRADVGISNRNCDEGNRKEEICAVRMNTVQCYTVRLYICTCLWPLGSKHVAHRVVCLQESFRWTCCCHQSSSVACICEWPVDKASEADWFLSLTTSYQLCQFVAPRSLLRCTCSSSPCTKSGDSTTVVNWIVTWWGRSYGHQLGLMSEGAHFQSWPRRVCECLSHMIVLVQLSLLLSCSAVIFGWLRTEWQTAGPHSLHRRWSLL
jgi:hypothetical protein